MPPKGSAFNKLFYDYQYEAKRRGLEFQLEEGDFFRLTQEPCHYCGISPSGIYRRSGDCFVFSGLDRIDNEEGYFLHNVVPSCSPCNRLKGDRSSREFVDQIARICHHILTSPHPKIR